MSEQEGVSRRGLMKGVAGAGAAAASLAVPSAAATHHARAESADITVAATVVRVTHSKLEDGALRIGVRASVRGADVSTDRMIAVVDPVRFGLDPAESREHISSGVKRVIAERLGAQGHTIDTDRVAVQVFGGVL